MNSDHMTDKKYTWDLSTLYPSTEEWEKAIKEIPDMVKKLMALRGKITLSAVNLQEALKQSDEISICLTRTYAYARMAFDVDMGNNTFKNRYERIDALATKVSDQLAFLEPELLNLTAEQFQAYKKDVPELDIYAHKFEKLFQLKEHILAPEMEELLAKMDSLGGSFKKVFDDITVNDLAFPEVKREDGSTIVANEANYRKCLGSQDRILRENYFKGLLSTYSSHRNSLTSTYYGSVKHQVFLAKTRNYKSSREMALSGNFIPVEVYDNLIETVRNNVTPLHQYISLRKKLLGLEEIHFYDLFVPLVKDIDRTYTFEKAQDVVLEALSVLGEDYTNVLKRAFDERWIDVYPGKGKRSGAYAMGIYGAHPYSLLNFTGTMDDVFTIAHELGHVMHSYFSNTHQPHVNSHYTIFTAEVASTVNETLLFHHLMSKTQSSEERALLLSMHLDSIRSTLYRQTFFADFEKQIHESVENEQPLTPDYLNSRYKELYEFYYGKDFVIDEELTVEWARIPHFYSAFYVYQYSTGVSAAISIAKHILENGKPALEGYRKFLTLGGSNYSIELLKTAGVDMSSPGPIIDAIKNFEHSLEQLGAIMASTAK